MDTDSSHELTRLFNSASQDPTILAEAIARAYNELREIAGGRMSRERANHTLCATALINEVYPHLFTTDKSWKNRQEFFKYASVAMRNALINHARARGTQRRGGRVNASDSPALDAERERSKIQFYISDIQELAIRSAEADQDLLLDIDAAILRLPEDEREVVNLLHYGGLGIAEVAEALSISERTVDRIWKIAKARLSRELASLREQME